MVSASWGEPEICMNIAMVTVKWRQTLQYLQVGKQLLVDKQACVVTVIQQLTQQEKVCKTKYSGIVCQRQHGKDGKHDC